MKIKNYRSRMKPEISAAAIEKALVSIGAARVGKEYSDGKLVGISFQLNQNGVPMIFKMNANAAGIQKTFQKNKHKLERSVSDQAEMTAWRLLLDEIEIKCARIVIEQSNPLKAFLSDIYNVNSDQTFFEMLEASKFKMLSAGDKKL